MSTIVIGLAPGDRGEAASHLAAMIAHSTGSPLVVAAITPEPWPPNPFLGDEEFLALQEARTKAAEKRTTYLARRLALDEAEQPLKYRERMLPRHKE